MIKNTKIFITNDDGVYAKGINELISVAREFGDVTVVAPNTSQSGKSSAITVDSPLRIEQIKSEENLKIFGCNGTPVDCVKLGLNQIVTETPNLLLSGINHGYNTSVSVIYSGTMGAAIEGAVHGIPSIGFSLGDFKKDADFGESKRVARQIIKEVLAKGLPTGTSLNVNIPSGEVSDICIGRQARGQWVEEFENRIDPHNRHYYWLTGFFDNAESHAPDTDETIVKNGRASVVPVTVDMTHYELMKDLHEWDLKI